MALMCSMEVSAALGAYKNQNCVRIIKLMDVAIPICTALFASFLPYSSLKMSVAKKDEANITFPSVCSKPKALINISTSILAVMVVNTVKAINPPFPNSQNHIINVP